jgi:ribosomal protein RSM22 (predicted rRNA methylase)
MEMPFKLRTALELQLKNAEHERMIRDSQNISLRYRTQSGRGDRLLTRDNEALSYAVSRMPATYGAVRTALEKTLAGIGFRPLTVIDAGAGTGAASWAAVDLLDLDSIVCLEREAAMRTLGIKLMEDGPKVLREAKWIEHDLKLDDIADKADLVIASYVLNEMTGDVRERTVQKLWDAAGMVLLLVEPGTPAGFSHLNEARRILLKQGAFIAAPCPHSADCPMEADDWCHFVCRVARSRLHRQMKGGEAPYEDEKFTYIAFVREALRHGCMRILRHPQVRGGHIMLKVCTKDGIADMTLSRKDGERYKKARKALSGDELI